MGDDPILTRARRGDRRALEELCHREWRPVYALLYAAVRDRAEAQDLTQEVFLRALGALGHFRAGEAPFRAFLKVIARNLLRDRWRGRRPSPVDLALIREVPSGDADLAEASAAAAERAQLLLALGTLPDDYQAVVRLRLLEGRAGAETAIILGRSPAAARQLLHRALGALRAALQQELRV